MVATESRPADLVRFFAIPSGSTCTPAYTVPSGKALILTSATAYLTGSHHEGETDLFSDASCSDLVAGFTTDRSRQTVNESFGGGVAVEGSIYMLVYIGSGTISGYGYLVPASSVPQVSATAPQRGHNFRGLVAR